MRLRLPDEVNIQAILLIGFWILLWVLLGGCSTTAVTRVEVRERVDTLLVKGDMIRVEGPSDTLLVERIDTLFRSVRAAIDTTVSDVRLYLQYAFPPDRWAADVISKDTVIRWTVRDSIIERPYKVEYIPFWVYTALAGMLIAIIALLRRK